MVSVEIPGYVLGDVLGRGGFASVYRAVQLAVGRDVAVKIDNRVLADDRDRRRFLREVTAAGRLSAHPHVVGIYDAGALPDGRPYLVMELCPGGSLDAVLRTGGPLAPAAVRDLGIGIADALEAAHRTGVLHRDIKPANILVNAYGVVGLSDFGLASVLAADGGQSATREALTPAFAAPEAFDLVDPSPQADVYALCATLYTLLSGTPPRFPRTGARPGVATILALHQQPVEDLPIPADFMAALRRGLETDPVRRWPSAQELRDALAAVDPRGLAPEGAAAAGWAPPTATSTPPALLVTPPALLATPPAATASPPAALATPSSTPFAAQAAPREPTPREPSPDHPRRPSRRAAAVMAGALLIPAAVLGWTHLSSGTPGSTAAGSTPAASPTPTAGFSATTSTGGSGTPGPGDTGAESAGATQTSSAPTIGRPLIDGAAVQRALGLVEQKVAAPLRLTFLAVASAGQYTVVSVDTRRPGDPLAVDRYVVTLDGQVVMSQNVSASTLLDPGQNQLTQATVDAKTWPLTRLPLERWRQVTAAVTARAKIRDGAITSWAAYVFGGKLQIVFRDESQYGGASVVADETGRITSVS